MSWTTTADLRLQLQKMWDRGILLNDLVTGESSFPIRLNLRTPTTKQIGERFDDVRRWITELRSLSHIRLEMREIRHPTLGRNQLPSQVWVDSAADAFAFIRKTKEAERLTEIVSFTKETESSLIPFLSKRPLHALELANDWTKLLAVVGWVKKNPRPDIYLRQVDIEGVHSKFIEVHRGVLAELLDLALPEEAIHMEAKGVSKFSARYGFREKPLSVRFRFLDSRHSIFPGEGNQDITVDSQTFSQLDAGVRHVYITENEVNFLCFPDMEDAMVIFGSGYGFDALASAKWLNRCRIQYWGDIDTHGFAILDQLRSVFAHTESLLMDRATLLEFKALWGEESRPQQRDLNRLNEQERLLYDDLRYNRIAERLRLEQERIGFEYVKRTLKMARNPESKPV